MAETLVLASLSVDASGVAGGIGQANTALQQGQVILGRFGAAQTALGSTTATVVGRLFNFRAAALAVARSLGVVGLVVSLALALKTLVSDLITSTTWFKNAKEAVSDWYHSLVLGEAGVDRLMRKMAEASKGGVRSYAEDLDKIRNLEVQRLSALIAIDELPFFKKTELAIARADLEAINVEMIEIADRLDKIGISRVAIAEATTARIGISASGLPAIPEALSTARSSTAAGPGILGENQNVPTVLEALGWPGPGVIEQRLAVAEEALKAFGATMRALGGQARDEIRENLIEMFTKAGLSIDEINVKFKQFSIDAITVTGDLGEALDPIPEKIDPIVERMNQLEEATSKANVKLGLAEAAAGAIAQAFGKAFKGDTRGIKGFFADILEAMVPVFLGYGAMGLVRGFFGDAAGFKIAAISFAAAGAAMVAARALGGGSSGESPIAAGGGGALVPSLPGGGGTSVSVNIFGTFHGDQNAFAREIASLIRRGERDGI